MASISITFSGESFVEVARRISEWAAQSASAPASASAKSGQISDPAFRAIPSEDAVRAVLRGIHGAQSRRLLVRLAELGAAGESLSLSDSLIAEFGASSGTAFSGMIGPVNRRAKEVMGSLLIKYPSPDPKARVWCLLPEHAKVVLDYYRS